MHINKLTDLISNKINIKRWYDFLGDAVNNIFVPFQIDYTYTDSEEDSFNGDTKPCNAAFDVRPQYRH